MQTNKLQRHAKKSADKRTFESRFKRFTRVMAAFTASLFIVSSNLSLAAQANQLGGQGAGNRLQNPMFEGMSRREIRQQIRQERHETNLNLQNINNGIVPQSTITNQINTVNQNALSRAANANHNRVHNGKSHQIRNTHQVFQTQNSGRVVRLDNGANLNLNSDARNITLGDKLFSDAGSVVIEIGGEKKTLYAGSQVTAAEYVAAKQALNGGQQLVVGADGKATGGTVDLNTVAATKNTMRADSLTVASGVTAVGDFGKHSGFRMAGDLDNYGSIYAVSTGGRHSGEIRADNITNQSGALISSNAGSNFGNKGKDVDLTLTADNNFSNLGTVESSGDLTINAGNSINNGSGASVTAKNNLNVDAPNVVNAGTMSATSGDLTLDTPVPAALNVNNSGGSLNALNGAINVRSDKFDAAFNSTVTGGDLLSKELNLNAGQGNADINVNQLTGQINGAGNAAHVNANTEELALGKICLTGDPTFYNTGAISLQGDIIVGEALAILAGTNITSTVGLTEISTLDGLGNGHDINIIAGFTLTSAGAQTGPVGPFPGIGTQIGAGQTVTVTNGGALGGSIDFTASPGLFINASGDIFGASGLNGGNVNLIARNNGGTTGRIFLPTDSAIWAAGTNGGTNGNITVLAGSNSAITTITLGSLITKFAGGGDGGSITVRNAQPSASAGTVFNEFGVMTGGGFTGGGTLANSGILIGDGNNVSVAGDTGVTVNGGANGVTLNLGPTGGLFNGPGLGNISITTTGVLNINTFAFGNVGSGNTTLIGNNGVTVTSEGIFGLGGDFTATANNGALALNFLTAGDQLGTGGGDVDISAAGNITFTNVDNIFTFQSPNGGNVTIEADSNNNGLGNLFGGNVNINTSGLGGVAGNVFLDSGDNVGQVLQIGSIFSVGSSGGNVGIGTLSGDAGDITIVGGVVSTGTFQIDANTNNHSANIGGGFLQVAGLDINLGTGSLNLASGGTNFSILTDSYNVAATSVNAAGLTLTIAPFSGNLSMGVAGGAGTVNISTAEFNQLIANVVNIGNSISGDITLGSSLNLVGRFAIEFDPLANFIGGANNIVSDRDVLINSVGSTTIGNITTSGTSNITVRASRLGGLGTLTSGALTINGNGNVDVFANDNVTVNGGINTNGGSISVIGDNVVITGSSSSANNDFVITALHDITVGAVTLPGAGSDILLTSILGNITTTGALLADPINMVAAGNINIGGNLTANDGIIVLAGQNITSSAAFNINANNPIGSGGNVTMVAGANFAAVGPAYQILGSSGTGGSINLTGGGGLGTLDTSGDNGAGGSVTMAAFSNGASGGQVLAPTTSSINTEGRNAGLASGDVTVVAGALNGAGIQLGQITTNAGNGSLLGSGTVALTTTSPVGGVSISIPDAAVTGSFLGGAIQGSSVLAANIRANEALVFVQSGSNVGLGAVDVSGLFASDGGSISVLANGTDTLDVGFAAGSNYIQSVNANGGLTAGDGGVIFLTNLGTSGMRVAPISINVVDGDGGIIFLDADQGNVQLNAGNFSVDGVGTDRSAGNIVINGSGVTVSGGNAALSALATGTGNGGTIDITTSGATQFNVGIGPGQVQLNVTGVNSQINLNIGGTINVVNPGTVIADFVSLTTTVAGSDIILNGPVAADFLFINAADAVTVGNLVTGITILDVAAGGNITTIGAGLLGGGDVSITSLAGNIGNNPFARLNVDATTSLTVNAFSGSAYLNDLNAVTLSTASTAANTFDLQAAGAIATVAGGTIGANNVVLRSIGSTITLGDVLTGGTSVSLRSNGNLTTTGAGIVVAPSVALRSDTGTIGTGTAGRFEIDSDFVTATATGLTGAAFIHDVNAVDVGPGPTSVTTTFDLLANGNISNSGTITAADVVLNTGGSFNISNLIIGGNSISLTSVGSITNGNFAGTLIAPQINLTTAGNIGTSTLSRFNIDASSVTLNAGGNVFLFDANDLNIGPTASVAGGVFNVLADNNLTVNGTVNAANVVLRATNGFLDVQEDITGTVSVNLRADGTLTTSGVGTFVTAPNMTLTSDNGNIGLSQVLRFRVDADNLSASAPNGSIWIADTDDLNISSPGGTALSIIDIIATGNLSTSAPVTGDDISLSSVNGTVTLGAAVTGNSLTINSFGDITNATVGTVLTFDTLILNSSNGSVGLTGDLLLTDANNITVTAANDVHIDQLDSTTLHASSAGLAFEFTAGGDVNIDGSISATTGLNLNAGGKFNFTANSTLDGGTDLTMTSTAATTSGASVNVNLIAGNIITVNQDLQIGGQFFATATNAAGQVNLMGVNAGSGMNISTFGGSVSADGDLVSAGTIFIGSEISFSTQGDITAGGDVNIVTNQLNNSFTISATNINVDSVAGGGLGFNGGAGGTLTASNQITLTGTGGDVTFDGSQVFNGTANINPFTNFDVIINNGANIVGNDTVNLNTCSLILNGNGTISGDPLNFNCPLGAGTIANSSGDIDLSGLGLVFNGQSLAIIASGNIIGGTATTIDLSNAAGSGGNLLVVAGFQFTPATVGQVNFSPTIYTFAGVSINATGGNVDLSGVNIITNGSAGGDAGNITIIGKGGLVNEGSVVTGNLTANTTGGFGGDILVIAQGGFTVGNLSNTGAVNGTITLAAATPEITGGDIRVQNGEQAGPGQFTVGFPQAAGTIANSNGNVDLTGLTLNFVGLDLAIIASGDVLAGANTSIDLSSGVGDGGTLLVVAGFDFSPATVGQVDFNAGTTYTFGGESATGGNIDFSGLNITTASTGIFGSSGDITLVANGAAGGAAGTVNVGNINTSSVFGAGGDLLIIAEGGFNTGTLNLTGFASNGVATLAAAEPTITGGPITVHNGIQGGTGQFTFTIPTGAGTIANSNGNVDLTGLTLNFTGLDLAIIASGNVIAGTTTTINLSSNTGSGGDLLVVAGFDFAPATAGQVNFNSGTLYTFGGQSTTGGNINFVGLNIDTRSTAPIGDGGKVTLVANGAAGGAAGTITTGNINTSSFGDDGGDILLIAEGGFVTGTLNTVGGSSTGTTTLAAATPVITGGVITVQNGSQGGPGQFTFTAPTGNGTIANSTGDVTLTGNLVFTGLNLAIIAANDILAGAATLIDLSNAGGTGGTLTLIAGFDFAPPTLGQVTNTTTTYTIGAANAQGGNIALGGVNILSNGITGGDVLAIAKGGTSSTGTITTGNIDVSGATTGGTVLAIGQGGITVGIVDTTGGTGGGDISLSVNTPTITGGQVFITNGNRTGTGVFVNGALGTGGVATGGMTSGNNIFINSNLAAGITLGNYTADGDITITNVGSVTIGDDMTSATGNINVNVNDIAGTAQALTIANGAILTADNQINLVNSGTDKKLDTILLDTNSSLITTAAVKTTAGVGDINIRLGATGQTELNNNNLPKGRFTVVENGGVLHLFGKKPRGEKPINNLTAQGADINISLQKSFTPKQLIFNGGVTVTADPPVAAGTPVYVNGKLVGENRQAAHASNNMPGMFEALTGTTLTSTVENADAGSTNLNTIENASTITGVNTLGVANTIGTMTGTALGTTNSNTMFGTVNATGDDNSYMVSFEGPTAAADASICSDSDLGTDGIARTAHSQTVALKKGNVLFVPFQKTVVETEQGTVTIDAKSTVLVSTTGNKLAVYNLDDNHKGAVSVSTNGQNFTLAPGSHATVTNESAGEFAQVNAIEAIPHRNVATRTISNGVKVHTSEFSIATAIQTVKPLKAVVGSNHPQAKKVADRLMKTTAILMHLSGNDYQHYFKPSLTAMAK